MTSRTCGICGDRGDCLVYKIFALLMQEVSCRRPARTGHSGRRLCTTLCLAMLVFTPRMRGLSKLKTLHLDRPKPMAAEGTGANCAARLCASQVMSIDPPSIFEGEADEVSAIKALIQSLAMQPI